MVVRIQDLFKIGRDSARSIVPRRPYIAGKQYRLSRPKLHGRNVDTDSN